MTTDDLNYASRLLKRNHALAEIDKTNRKALFDVLAAIPATLATVTFDGAGDSGGIESVCLYNGDQSIDVPKTTITVLSTNPQAAMAGTPSRTAEQTLVEAIESICFDWLECRHPGWEIDGGSFGTFEIDVAARTVRLEFNSRYIQIDTIEDQL